ncbi:hypothetical protein [Micromonospora sp. NPDC003241]
MGFSYSYERHEEVAVDTVYHLVRDEFQNITLLKVLRFVGDLAIPGLRCAAVVAACPGGVVGHRG